MARAASIARLIKDLKKLHAKYAEELPSEDIDAILSHLGGPYHEGMGPKEFGTSELAEKLNRIIEGAPRIPEDMTTFRGTTVKGAIPQNEYPLTTSYDRGTAETYAESWMGDPGNPALQLEIEVPKGSPGLVFDEKTLEDISGEILPFGDELELLLPHGDMELIRRYDVDIGVKDELLRTERKRYIPPYKARGGLINGYT